MSFFKRFRFAILAAAFSLITLAVFSINASREPGNSFFDQMVLEITGPVQSALTWVGNSLDYVIDTYLSLINTNKRNRELTAEVARLRQQLADMADLRLANSRLRDLLSLREKHSYPAVAAELIASDPTGRFRTTILNKGSRDGVAPAMPVINIEGVVGRVVTASPGYCKVLLLTDPNSGVDVLVQRSRARGVLRGDGEEPLKLLYLLQSDDVAPGDNLITSGAAGVFPKGLLVGTVKEVVKQSRGGFLLVTAEPAVDFARLEEVLILLRQSRFARPVEKP